MQRFSESDELIAVGKILRAVGLEGFCSVEPFGFTLESLKMPCKVCIGIQENSSKDILLEELDFRPKNLVCRFQGILDKDSAESLRGNTIYVLKSELPSLGQDEYYHFELIGMKVYTDNSDEPIGTVSQVHNFPSADTIEIERSHRDSLLIPLTGESIIRIDKSLQCIIFKHSFVEELL